MRATPIPTRSRALVIARARDRCERCGVLMTVGHWHHRRSRSVRDDHTHCPCNGVWLCRGDHEWVHAHPMEARQGGFILSRVTAIPAVEPVETPWGMRLHSCDGTYKITFSD